MKKLYPYLPLILFLGGCSAMQWLGMADATGEPTAAGHAANEVVRGLTGMDVLKVWGATKGAEALFTKRGLQNTANLLNPASSWPGTWKSLAALVGLFHTPAEAKSETQATSP